MTKKDMKVPRKPRKKSEIEAKLEAMTAMILNLTQKVEVLGRGSDPLPNPHEVPIVDNARDSCTADALISTLPEGQYKCDLLAMYPQVVVARGQVVILTITITTQEMIHGVPLLKNQRRVMVDKTVVLNAPLPFPTEEFQVVNDAIATFVPWPINQIRLITEKEKKSKGRIDKKSLGKKGKTVKTGASVTIPIPEKKAPGGGGGRTIHTLSFVLHGFDNLFEQGHVLDVVVSGEIVGHDSIAQVDRVCVDDINSLGWMSTTSLLVYVKYLAIEARNLEVLDMFQFVDPQLLNETYVVDIDKSLEYLIQRIVDARKDKIVLVSHLSHGHWVMYAYNPERNTVYVFDSLPLRDNVDFYTKREGGHHMMEKAIKGAKEMLRAKGIGFPASVFFVIVETPKQPNSNDCGYYVCWNMLQLV